MSEITRGAYTTFKYTYKTICPQHYTAYRPNSTFTVELQCIQANTGGTQTTKEFFFDRNIFQTARPKFEVDARHQARPNVTNTS